MQTPYLSSVVAVLDGLKFETKKAVLIGFTELDCMDMGVQKFLLRTAKGRFYIQSQNEFKEPKNSVEYVSKEQAQSFWNTCDTGNKLLLTKSFPGTRPRLA